MVLYISVFTRIVWYMTGILLLFFISASYRQLKTLGPTVFQGVHEVVSDSNSSRFKKTQLKRILLYSPPTPFSYMHGIHEPSFFQDCMESNCILSLDKRTANISDAVLVDYLGIRSLVKKKRPEKQVWVYLQREPTGTIPKDVVSAIFNWTMTYSKQSDIYLPYGMLKNKFPRSSETKNYSQIAINKSRDALWVVSHCKTKAKREIYTNILQKYIKIDILGACGTRWKCGRRWRHDECFGILDHTYRFFLAFEQQLCTEYITEKFFDNYNYNTIQVVRGGVPHNRPINTTKGVYISASDFDSAHHLGKYLKALSKDVTEYTNLLRKKEEFENIPYQTLFQNAMCDICYRLHHIDKYRFIYKNIREWLLEKMPCYEPDDI